MPRLGKGYSGHTYLSRRVRACACAGVHIVTDSCGGHMVGGQLAAEPQQLNTSAARRGETAADTRRGQIMLKINSL